MNAGDHTGPVFRSVRIPRTQQQRRHCLFAQRVWAMNEARSSGKNEEPGSGDTSHPNPAPKETPAVPTTPRPM